MLSRIREVMSYFDFEHNMLNNALVDCRGVHRRLAKLGVCCHTQLNPSEREGLGRKQQPSGPSDVRLSGATSQTANTSSNLENKVDNRVVAISSLHGGRWKSSEDNQ